MTDEHREEETPTLKIMGRIFAALALPILILVALLQNMEDKSLPMISLLLGVGGMLFIVGLIISVVSCLPQETNKEGNRKMQKKVVFVALFSDYVRL